MVSGAASGAVDFSRARPADPHWWLGLAIILDEIERRQYREILRAKLDGLAVGRWQRLTAEASAKINAEYWEHLEYIRQLALPWLDSEQRKALDAGLDQLKAEWEAAYGKIDDPETQSKIRQTVEALRRVEGANAAG